jgi:hypothetical protein
MLLVTGIINAEGWIDRVEDRLPCATRRSLQVAEMLAERLGLPVRCRSLLPPDRARDGRAVS